MQPNIKKCDYTVKTKPKQNTDSNSGAILESGETKEILCILCTQGIDILLGDIYIHTLGLEDPLGKEMATHSSTLAQKITWKEDPGGLQSKGCKELDMTERLSTHAHIHTHTHLYKLQNHIIMEACTNPKRSRTEIIHIELNANEKFELVIVK